MPAFIAADPKKTWAIILILYCFAASTTPVWILLQPRDYLSSYLLYASVLGGFVGIVLGGFSVSYPAYIAWTAPQLGSLFPILFISVACGACSGFHSIVASGTTSKQLNKESDAKAIGYGAMLFEGVVAVVALTTVAMLSRTDELAGQPPLMVYGNGIARFLGTVGIPHELGFSFGLLALSAFILTTLDTATRLGRYIFEEFFNLKGARARYLSTVGTLLLPAIFVLITLNDPLTGAPVPAWKAIWPAFGASNQLLAGLVLLVVAVWMKKAGKRVMFLLLPMVFMNVMTIWGLVMLLLRYRASTVGLIAAVLLVLAAVVIFEAVRTIKQVAPGGTVVTGPVTELQGRSPASQQAEA
jgi:carbon starvation protein